jgi:replication initiation and membrane attachment protein DnaB
MSVFMEHSAMNQKIFEMGLSTETVSLYLLCCGIADSGATLSAKNLLEIWNASPEAMNTSFLELENLGIVLKIISDGKTHHIYKLTNDDDWNEYM